MRCTVDDKLLEEARSMLGTTSADETINASLRQTINASRVTNFPTAVHLTTEEEWTALRKRLHTPPIKEELARRRATFEAMERLRVKVGRDFNVAAVIREMRDQAADGRTAEEYDER